MALLAWARRHIAKVRAFINNNPAAQTLTRVLVSCFAFGKRAAGAVVAFAIIAAIAVTLNEHKAVIAMKWGSYAFLRDLMVALAAAFALAVAIWRTSALGSQAKTAEKRLLNEQFANAVELMAKETTDEKPKPAIAARTGGIYILADLAIKRPAEFAELVVKNLIAYIKDHAQLTATPELKEGETPAKPRTLGGDVKAAFSVLSSILGNPAISINKEILDFSQANFSMLDFRGIDLWHYKRWTKTKFVGCYLIGTHFADGADFRDADFRGAVLVRAIMRGAKLDRAYMQGCFMSYAILEKANSGEKTNLLEAQLAGADLMGASLNSALIYKTDIRGAVLSSGADLTNIEHLIDATLGETYMINANIEESDASKLSKWAKSAGRKIWLDHAEVDKQVNDPGDKTDWRLKEYDDGYALAGVLANFANAPSYEYSWEPAESYLPKEIKNIQRQAAELDLDKLPPNTPEEIKVWLEEIKAKYPKREG